MRKVLVGGLRIFAPESRSELIEEAVNQKCMLIAINAEKITYADEWFKILVNDNLGYPDGFGAVLGLRWKGLNEARKIPGCELWLDLISKYHSEKTFYFVGGTQEVIDDTVARLKGQFPRINIVGFRNGFLNGKHDRRALVGDVSILKPDIVFVAMGSPKQELLMKEMRQNHPAVYMGLGGSFDIYTNKVKRAPNMFLLLNLEWLFRLFHQPKRLLRQRSLFTFVCRLVTNRL